MTCSSAPEIRAPQKIVVVEIAPEKLTLTRKDTMASAGNKLCHALTMVLDENVPGAKKGEDSEYIHRMRVAVRKLRFVLQLWNGYIEKGTREALREELKWIAGVLGLVRDADVIAQRLEMQWDTQNFSAMFKAFIRKLLSKRRAHSMEILLDVLSSDRYKQLISSINQLFPIKPAGRDNPELKSIVSGFFGVALKKAGRFAGRKIDLEELHPFRITFKRLRYVTEFFGTLYAGKLVVHGKQFKKYQEILGSYCDAQVTEHFLNGLIASGTTSAVEMQEQHLVELGGLLFLQKSDADTQYRRFLKKAADLPAEFKLLRQHTKHL